MLLPVALLLAVAATPTPRATPAPTPTPERTPAITVGTPTPIPRGSSPLSGAATGRKLNREALKGWDPKPVDPASQTGGPSLGPAVSGLEAGANAFCREKWKTDFNMVAYCQGQQREALEKLGQPGPLDVPSDAFSSIRSACAAKWGPDLTMRVYCEETQIRGYRSSK